MNAQAPAWLFSFVDLAFLLLIAMTQVSVESNGLNLDLGEIAVPKIDSEATENLTAGAAERWQVRIHAAALSEGLPYELVRVDPGKSAPGERMDSRTLRERLEVMHAADRRGEGLNPNPVRPRANAAAGRGETNRGTPGDRVFFFE